MFTIEHLDSQSLFVIGFIALLAIVFVIYEVLRSGEDVRGDDDWTR